ncbi:MAG: hypothetical protein FWD12_01765, partial [Alphaproteobacteria bacterium]|nr:hypothetical protein [Alphaproteobacteria bacterium]
PTTKSGKLPVSRARGVTVFRRLPARSLGPLATSSCGCCRPLGPPSALASQGDGGADRARRRTVAPELAHDPRFMTPTAPGSADHDMLNGTV